MPKLTFQAVSSSAFDAEDHLEWLAHQILCQAELNRVLRKTDSSEVRRVLFDAIRPYLRFENPECP
jgi:hypothetical protein